MWKDKFYKKGLRLYLTQYRVRRNLLSGVINALKNGGVEVYDIRHGENGYAYFSTSNKHEKKVFAIIKELWYNEKVIEKTAKYGFFFPLYNLISNAGLFFGVIAFVVISYLSSFLVLDFKVTGSGREYGREIIAYLNANGVKKYRTLRGVDLTAIKNGALIKSPNLSFIEIKKEGFNLVIDLELLESKKPIQSNPVYELLSSCSGRVTSVKVYRGTPLIKVGDVVNCGDVLVGGYYNVGEEKVACTVIASVTVLTKNKFEYKSSNDNEEQIALILAEQSLGEEYKEFFIEKTKNEREYVYTVWLHAEREIIAT